MGYTFKRPDPAAMERILTQFPYSPEGAILRLAWLDGKGTVRHEDSGAGAAI